MSERMKVSQESIMILLGASYYQAKRALDWRDEGVRGLYAATLRDYAALDCDTIYHALQEWITRHTEPPTCAEVRALLEELLPRPERILSPDPAVAPGSAEERHRAFEAGFLADQAVSGRPIPADYRRLFDRWHDDGYVSLGVGVVMEGTLRDVVEERARGRGGE